MPGLSVKQLPPISTSGQSRTSASWLSAPRKAGQDARSFREVSSPTRVTAIRRQDAANQHQRERANLGFARFRPKESRAGCPVFP